MAGTTTVAAKGDAARVKGRQARNTTAYLPLALWRMRRMWPVLALVEIGMLCAVLLLCAVPLFTRVATVAGLRGALTASPETAYFWAFGYTNTPTSANLDEAGRRSQAVLQRNFAAFGIGDVTAFDLTGTPLPIAAIDGSAGASGKMGFYGLTASAMTGRMRVVAGRLPRPAAQGALEAAITQETARQLNVHLDSSLLLGSSAAGGKDGVPLRIVGIVDPVPQEVRSYSAPGSLDPNSGQYWAVVSAEAVSQSGITWEAVAAFAGGQAGPQPPGYWIATWTYHASLSHLEQLDLSDPEYYQELRYQSGLELNNLPGINSAYVFGGAPDVLYSYAVRLQLAQAITFLLLVVVLGLVLLFLSLMANVLVERQEGLIALLRSRGASKGQITAAFLIQSVLLGIIALAVGALLAVPLVRGIAAALLPAGNAAALAVLNGDPLQVAEGVILFAVIAVVITIAGTFWAVRRAARRNVHMSGQEATRATTKPLWQRLYLDVLAALLALLGYGAFTLAMTLTTTEPTLDSERTRYLLSPLALLAPPFLTIAGALLFLRLFPVALRLSERMAIGRRGAPALLALTQLARASRPALRVTLLLALALGFALFTLNTLTTADQRVTDVALHQAGADFSGSPAASGGAASPAALAGEYRAIPGVVSATAGYRTATLQRRQPQGSLDNPPILQLVAVDADTFAGTALWSMEDSAQPLADLMALLRAGRARAEADHVVPALLDAQLWKTLGLREGQTFTLPTPDQDTGEMRFLALKEVQHIPTMTSSTGFNFGPPTGGMLVDYESFAAAYAGAARAELRLARYEERRDRAGECPRGARQRPAAAYIVAAAGRPGGSRL